MNHLSDHSYLLIVNQDVYIALPKVYEIIFSLRESLTPNNSEI